MLASSKMQNNNIVLQSAAFNSHMNIVRTITFIIDALIISDFLCGSSRLVKCANHPNKRAVSANL